MSDYPASYRQREYLKKILNAKTKHGALMFGEEWLKAWDKELFGYYLADIDNLTSRQAGERIKKLMDEGWDHAMGPVRLANVIKRRQMREVGFSYDDPKLQAIAGYQKPVNMTPATARQTDYLEALWRAKHGDESSPPRFLTKTVAGELINRLVQEGYGQQLRIERKAAQEAERAAQMWERFGEAAWMRGDEGDPHGTACGVDGCGKRRVTRGWCPSHYQRWLKTGDPVGVR